jgi:hypothetical protein
MYPTASEGNKVNPTQSSAFVLERGPAPSTRRTLSTALDQQGQDIGALHIHLDELEARIRLLLDPPSPHPSGGGAEKAVDPCGPLDLVERHNYAIRAAIQRVGELTSRIHL